jgi:hypothetical protein
VVATIGTIDTVLIQTVRVGVLGRAMAREIKT